MTMQETATADATMEGWGHCPRCKRWRTYETGTCAECETHLEGHVTPDKELARRFFLLLLAVQDFDDEDIVKYRGAGYWYNASTDEVRRAVKDMTSAAVLANALRPQPDGAETGPALGAPMITLPDGSQWETEIHNGGLRPVRPVPTPTAQQQPAPKRGSK